jgi:hypothetical protein
MNPVRCFVDQSSVVLVVPPVPFDTSNITGDAFRLSTAAQNGALQHASLGGVARPSSYVIRFKDTTTFDDVFRRRAPTFLLGASICFCGPSAFPIMPQPPVLRRSTSSQSIAEEPVLPLVTGLESTPEESGHTDASQSLALVPVAPVDNTTKGRCITANQDASGDDWHNTPFDAKTLLTALKLSQRMKSNHDMKGTVLLALQLCLDDQAYTQVLADMEAKRTRIPAEGCLMNAKIKLDIMAMLGCG